MGNIKSSPFPLSHRTSLPPPLCPSHPSSVLSHLTRSQPEIQQHAGYAQTWVTEQPQLGSVVQSQRQPQRMIIILSIVWSCFENWMSEHMHTYLESYLAYSKVIGEILFNSRKTRRNSQKPHFWPAESQMELRESSQTFDLQKQMWKVVLMMERHSNREKGNGEWRFPIILRASRDL